MDTMPAWHLTKVKNKSEVIAEARTKGHTIHFTSLMNICHLKKSELEPHLWISVIQKYKGRVVLRGDIVKGDSGSYAVFTEQGSSASQVTAAKVKDIISRLLGCAGQASDAVSAYTQVKMGNAPKLLKTQSQNVQILGYVYQNTKGEDHDPVWKIQSSLLNRNLYGHPLAGLLWERQFEKVSIKIRLGKSSEFVNAYSLTE